MATLIDTDHELRPSERAVDIDFVSTDSGEGYPLIDINPKFVFGHHRRRWAIMDGKVVPELSRFPMQSGINGVMVDPRSGKVNTSRLQTALQDRHFVWIPPNKGPNNRTYLKGVDTAPHGQVKETVITVFETASAGETKTEWDYPAYAAWLTSLVEDGIIRPISPQRAREKLEESRKALAKAKEKLAKNRAESDLRVKALEVEVAAWAKAAQVKGAKAVEREVEIVEDEDPTPAPERKNGKR